MVSPAVAAAVVGLLGTVLVAISRHYYNKWQSALQRVDKLEGEVERANNRVDKLMAILFGRESDKSDDGLTTEVQDGFEELAVEMDDVEGEVDDMDTALSVVIIRLDEDEDVDFDKENLDYEAELKQLLEADK